MGEARRGASVGLAAGLAAAGLAPAGLVMAAGLAVAGLGLAWLAEGGLMLWPPSGACMRGARTR